MAKFVAGWEYQFLANPGREAANEMGADGWEMVCHESRGDGTGFIWFKRPRIIVTDEDDD